MKQITQIFLQGESPSLKSNFYLYLQKLIFINQLPVIKHDHSIKQINLYYLVIKHVVNFIEANRNITERLPVTSIQLHTTQMVQCTK